VKRGAIASLVTLNSQNITHALETVIQEGNNIDFFTTNNINIAKKYLNKKDIALTASKFYL
jgi:hypothetical protein